MEKNNLPDSENRLDNHMESNSEQKHITRRDALQSVALSTGAIAFTGTAIARDENEKEVTEVVNEDGVSYKTVRATHQESIQNEEVKNLREEFIKDRLSNGNNVLLNPEKSLENDNIIAYNLILDGGEPREQYVISGGKTKSDIQRQSITTASEQEKHEKADKMLEKELEAGSKVTNDLSTSSTDYDWSDWTQTGGTDMYYDFPEAEELDARPGGLDLNIEIREDTDLNRAAAHINMRMEAGHQLCINGEEEFCSSDNRGFKHRDFNIHQDWDQPANSVSGTDLLQDANPGNTENEQAMENENSLGLSLSGTPGVEIGHSTSYDVAETDVTDHTTTRSEFARHEIEFNNPDSDTAKRTAEMTVSSVVATDYDDCNDGHMPVDQQLLAIAIQGRWGVNHNSVTGWSYTESNSRTFRYDMSCLR